MLFVMRSTNAEINEVERAHCHNLPAHKFWTTGTIGARAKIATSCPVRGED
jgi:hypothetical protein